MYYTHLYPLNSENEGCAVQLDVESSDLEGRARAVVPNAIWPALSPDGSRLAYLAVDDSGMSSELYLAGADGARQRPVFLPGSLPPIDDHLFSADGSQLVFSMVNGSLAPIWSRWDRLLGIETASAHSVPSDWYVSSLDGSRPQRLTNTMETNLAGALSPDGSRLAFLGTGGLYVVETEGGEPIRLSDGFLAGSVDWIP